MWSRERKVLKVVTLLSSFCTILLKWEVAVLFTKAFSELSAARNKELNQGGGITFEAESELWKFIFLVDLTFEQTLGIAAVTSLVMCITQATYHYINRILAEKQHIERRSKIVWTATNGSNIVGGKAGSASNEVVMITEVINSMKEHELLGQLNWQTANERILISFIFGLILVPILTLVIVALFVVIGLFEHLGEKKFIDERAKLYDEVQADASLHVLDIVRGADIVAVSDTAKAEQSSVVKDGAELIDLQRDLSKYNSIVMFASNLPTSFALPITMLIVYYGYEILGDDPVETSFNVLAFLIILEEIHKAMLFKIQDKSNLRRYKENKAILKDWLDDRDTSDQDDKGLNHYIQPVDIKIEGTLDDSYKQKPQQQQDTLTATIIPVTSYKSSSWTPGDLVLRNVSISYSSYKTSELPLKEEVTGPVSQFGVSTFWDPDSTQRYVFEKRTLVFPFKKRTALVGESGSGKSTILKMIAGLLLPDEGRLSFGTLRIIPKNLSLLRRRMGYCSQDSLLFARTIRENVWYGHQGPVDDEKIINVLENVGLGEWLSDQPYGLSQDLGLGEGTVSGGQAQRLQLARLLCRDYVDLVLLDEACSALDAKNRKIVLRRMKKFLENKTAIWITHHMDVLQEMEAVVDLTENQKKIQGSFSK